MAKDARVDEYIGKAADFAQPILQHLRALVHRALPDAVETIKWGMPHFTVDGKNVAGIAGFKAHCALVIHGDGRQGDSMGRYGKITALSDLSPEADLIAGLQTARSRILEQGSATKKPVTRQPKAEVPMPADFAAALAQVPETQSVFEGFSPSARRDYLEWITEAKTDATRTKRMAQAIEWIALGKKRNWKYEKC
jgi:uncharacterized protein YdeI (YjbR/CyaY-like superfamily)